MNNPLPWFKVEMLQVADDLSDVGSLEAEGAYFRILRHLWLNGPQPMDVIRRKCKKAFDEIEHVFSMCSTGVEHEFSISWLERQRDGVNEWREVKRQAGIKSGLSRAKKGKKKANTSSTGVQLVSTSVEHATSTSISTLNSEKKGQAAEGPKYTPEFEAVWVSFERYGAKGDAFAYWQRLTPEDHAAIVAKIPAYVASTPGCEYRKQLEGWINPKNRLWERPIVVRSGDQKPAIPGVWNPRA